MLAALSLSLLLQPSAASLSRPQGVTDLLDPVQRMRASLADKRAHLDPALLGVDGVLAQIGIEPDALAAFVAGEVAYSPYRGSMLGADGVAATRRGNALDQSVMLAALLNRAGHEARIVGASLEPAMAQRLLAQWISQDHPELLPYLPGTPSAQSIASRIGDLDALAMEEAGERDRLLAARERGRGHALAAAQAAGVDMTPRDDRDALLEIAADYHWVQYRDAPFSDWQSFHPAFGSEGPGEADTPEPATYFTGTLPDDLVHRVGVRGYIERTIGGKLSRQAITSEWSAPVANLEGAPVTFTILPLDPTDGDQFDTAKVFVPFINGVRAPGAMMFDLSGTAIDSGLLDLGTPGSMLDLILTFSEKGGEAVGLLDGLDMGLAEEPSTEEPAESELLRVIVAVTTSGPEGSKTHERVLFDRSNSDGSVAAWSEFSLAEMLYRHFAFVADAGFAAPARTLDKMLVDLDRRLAADEFDIANWGKAQTPALARERADFIGAELATPGFLYRAFATLSGPETAMALDAHLAAPTAPSIVAVASSPIQTGERLAARTVVDIVSVRWATWTRPAEPAAAIMRDPVTMAAFGAAVTLEEAELVGVAAGSAAPGLVEANSAWALLDREGVELTLASEPANAAMAADIKRGHRAVVAMGPNGEETGAWWSVDPASGLAIGMTKSGGSAELTDYITGLLTVSMGVLGAYMGAKSCTNHPNPDCCTAAAVGIGVVLGGFVGFGGGVAVASVTATATGTAFALGLTRVMLAVEFEFIASAAMQLIPTDYGLC